MPSILIVDDSRLDRRLAGHLLQQLPGKNEQLRLHYAETGEEALNKMSRHLPDLVLTDILMPGMDGFSLVSAVHQKYPLVPVILMTGQGSEITAARALQEGAASYVPKEELQHELVDVTRRVLALAAEARSQALLMTRLTRCEQEFLLDNDLALIPAVVNYLQRQLADLHFCNEPNRLRIGVALEEALLNAYYHGNLEVGSELREQSHTSYYNLARKRVHEPPYRSRQIRISSTLTPEEICFQVEDEGPGFDPASVRDALAEENQDRPSGRGLLLMRTFMDEVSFNNRGNQVTMKKRRPEPPRPESLPGEP